MTGHKPFSELTKDFSPQRKAQIEAEKSRLREEMMLQELREALNIQQEELGERPNTKQAVISHTEQGSDLHLSNLRKTIEAMGGELILIARFSNVDVCLNKLALENRQASVVTESEL